MDITLVNETFQYVKIKKYIVKTNNNNNSWWI